jgi:predicted dehydrogenase
VVKVGVIGCGFIAQDMHLPFLTGTEGGGIPEIEVVAVCDIVEELTEAIAQRYNIAEVYLDHRAMLEKSDIDAVAILTTGDHTELCVDAMNAGKHVFVEKPLCYSVKRVKKILQAQEKNNVILQLGYMKRYDPGYEIALREFTTMQEISLVRAHKYMPLHGNKIGKQILRVLRFPRSKETGFSGSSIRSGREQAMLEQLGEASEEEKVAYMGLVVVLGHVLNALLGIFGEPLGVLRTEITRKGRFITSLLDYDEFVCVCEYGRPSPKKWDEFILAYSPEKDVKVTFSHSWLKNRPAIVNVTEREQGEVRRTIEGSYEEAFRREWESFVQCLNNGSKPKVSIHDGEMIVRICSAMIDNYRSKETVSI